MAECQGSRQNLGPQQLALSSWRDTYTHIPCLSAEADGPFPCARALDPCIAANPAALSGVYILLSVAIIRSHTSLQVPNRGNPEQATGSYLAGIAGVRISTPLFGTGFNFCVGVDKASAPLLLRAPSASQGFLANVQCIINITCSIVCAVYCRPLFWQLPKGGHHHPKRGGLAPARISGAPLSYMCPVIVLLRML